MCKDNEQDEKEDKQKCKVWLTKNGFDLRFVTETFNDCQSRWTGEQNGAVWVIRRNFVYHVTVVCQLQHSGWFPFSQFTHFQSGSFPWCLLLVSPFFTWHTTISFRFSDFWLPLGSREREIWRLWSADRWSFKGKHEVRQTTIRLALKVLGGLHHSDVGIWQQMMLVSNQLDEVTRVRQFVWGVNLLTQT